MRRPRRVSRHLARQPFGTRRAARCPSLRTRQGPLPVPHDTSRHDLVPATPGLARQARSVRASAAPLAVVVRPPPRATANVAYGAFAMRRPPMLLRCSEALAQLLGAAFTRRALRPGNVASGDQCVRGTLAPRHHAGTNILLSKALGATGRKAALAPRHYRISLPSDMPRKAPSVASGRRSGSDGALRLRPPAPRTPPRRGASSRWRGSPRCRMLPGSSPAGSSGRSRQPSAAPASRCRDRPPASPHATVGRRLVGTEVREVAGRREQR